MPRRSYPAEETYATRNDKPRRRAGGVLKGPQPIRDGRSLVAIPAAAAAAVATAATTAAAVATAAAAAAVTAPAAAATPAVTAATAGPRAVFTRPGLVDG